MKHSTLARCLLSGLTCVLLAVSPGTAQITREGDVSLSSSTTPDAPCPACPGGKGTLLQITVQITAEPENDLAKDFHVRTGDDVSSNFQCYAIERLFDGEWQRVSGWTGSHESQREGDATRHYVSWYAGALGEALNKGETFRFSVVYCGDPAKLDDTIEFILTQDGTRLPRVPDASGNRGDVPDSGASDDPAWVGQKRFPSNPKAGFVTSVLDVGPLIAGQVGVFQVFDQSPFRMQYLIYSLTGSGDTYVPQLNVTLGLFQPQLAAQMKSDQLGNAVWQLPIPLPARNRQIYFQVAEYGSATNVVMRTVQ